MCRHIGLTVSVFALTMVLCGCGPSQADEAQIEEDLEETEVVLEEEADAVLREMSDFLAAAKQFSLTTLQTVDEVLETGQEVQLERSGKYIVQRPNRLSTSFRGSRADMSIFYEGGTLTYVQETEKVYATAAVPETLDDMLDFVADELGIIVPASDLFYSNPYESLMLEGTSGLYVGLEPVSDVECHHLFFANDHVDWQIWVEAGEQPVPRKFLITYKHEDASPQFVARFDDWDFSSNSSNSNFTFTPPSDYEEIQFHQVEQSPLPESEGSP